MTKQQNKQLLYLSCLIALIVGADSIGLTSVSPSTSLRVHLDADPNCFQFNGPQCVTCSYRYYFGDDGLCTEVSTQCQTWDSVSGKCTSCYSGWDLTNGDCVDPGSSSSSSSTDPNCQTSNGSTCTQCYYGYYIKNGVCSLSNPLCKTYDQWSGDCTSCYDWYTLSGGNCVY
jgi:hypothetical protein